MEPNTVPMTAAKANAALLLPWAVFAVEWLIDAVGITQFDVDPAIVERGLTSACLWLAVYFTKNTPKRSRRG